jgi:hypothetical protein
MTMIDLSRCSIGKALVSASTAIACLLGMAQSAAAETVIRRPGQHPQYGFELEPHLAVTWWDAYYTGEGIGPGVHFAIPFLQQGPISNINNSMAIKFGVDLTFGNGCYGDYRYRYYYDNYCHSTTLLMPVALQWNFYFTDIITGFAEIGMAIGHTWWSYDGACSADGRYCNYHHDRTYPLFYSALGAKFMFSKMIGLTVRMGYPMATVGASFLF